MLFQAARLCLGIGLFLRAQALINVEASEGRNYDIDRCQSLGCPTRVIGENQLIYETVWGATTRRVLVAAPTGVASVGQSSSKASLSITTGFTITSSSNEHLIPSESVDGYEIHVSEGFEVLINGKPTAASSTNSFGSVVLVPAGSHLVTIRYTRPFQSTVYGSHRIVRISGTKAETKLGFKIPNANAGYQLHIDEHSDAQGHDLIVTTPVGTKTTLEIVINGHVVGHTVTDPAQPGLEVAVVPLPQVPGTTIVVRPAFVDAPPGYVWVGNLHIAVRPQITRPAPPVNAGSVVVGHEFSVTESSLEYVVTLPPGFDASIAGEGHVLELSVSPGFEILIDGVVVATASTGQGGTSIRLPLGQPKIVIRYTLTISGGAVVTGWYEIKHVFVGVVTRPQPAPVPVKPAPIPIPEVSEKPVSPDPKPVEPNPPSPVAPAPACTPTTLKPWTKFSHWKAEWLKGPHEFDVNFDTDTEITVTDDENKTERFEILVDGVSVGKTNDFTVERSSHCGSDADKCIERGWGHGTFPIPAGQHKISIKLIGNDIDGGWWYFAGQYKIVRKCGEPARPVEPAVTPTPSAKPITRPIAAPACTASIVKPWTKFSHWKAEWLKGPHEFDVNYDYDTEITVTDDENKTERFEIFVDGTSVGKTNDFTVERSSHCGSDADKCIEKGWGHGTFPIPAGQHKIGIKLIGNDIDGGWWYFAGQYKIARNCPKASVDHEEL